MFPDLIGDEMRLCGVAWALIVVACFAPESVAQCPNANVTLSGHQNLCGTALPNYPPLAKAAKVQGTVILKVKISKVGIVQNVYYASGHPLLVPAAIEAVRHWKLKPYLSKGAPIDVDTTVEVNYKLDEGAGPRRIEDNASHPNCCVATGARISSTVMQSFLLTKVNPVYPPEAKAGHVEGTVSLRVKIDQAGNLYDVDDVSGPPLLIQAAIDAVKQWKYKPYLLSQKPVEVETTVDVAFEPSRD
jgi:TonB family protein